MDWNLISLQRSWKGLYTLYSYFVHRRTQDAIYSDFKIHSIYIYIYVSKRLYVFCLYNLHL